MTQQNFTTVRLTSEMAASYVPAFVKMKQSAYVSTDILIFA